jgi:hypothetical protein
LVVGAVLKGENYWEMLPELAERSRAVEKEEEGGKSRLLDFTQSGPSPYL